MLLNVMGLISALNQKRVSASCQRPTPEARARRVAFPASRTNVVLSLPLLFFMSASGGSSRTAMF